jgi:hypothetical protein
MKTREFAIRLGAVPEVMMTHIGPFDARMVSSVADFSKSAWDGLFGGSAFGWDFCRAAEAAPPPGFRLSAIGVFRGASLVAAAPLFETLYRLDMSFPRRLRSVGSWIHSVAPKLLSVPVLGLGSPVMDRCQVGFSTALDQTERGQTWRALVKGLQEHGLRSGSHLVAIKDLAEADSGWADRALGEQRFSRLASLPIAVLDLPYTSEGEYLASLSRYMRRDIKRKLHQSEGVVRFEVRSSILDVEQEIASLYEATRSHRQADFGDFDALSPEYVGRVLEEVGERAQVALGWVGGELASFALYLIESDRVFAHQIGMRYPLARQHNLYFLNWMLMVRICLKRGIRRLEMGQTCYPQKIRLGCRLEKSWVYFRHRAPPVNAVMGVVAPQVGFDSMESQMAN